MGYLTGSEIISRCYVIGDTHCRDIGLDLKIDCIVKNGEKFTNEHYVMQPQEMVVIVFKGNISLPEHCYGVAYPKTSMCQRGLQILSSGIIDPGYNGYASTLAINFSKETIELRKDDVCMRLIIYNNDANFCNSCSTTITIEDYIKNRCNDSKSYPDTFLDVPLQIKNLTPGIEKNISSTVITKLVSLLTIGTLLFAAASFWIGCYNVNNMQDNFSSKIFDHIKDKSSINDSEISILSKKLDSINSELELLKKQQSKKFQNGK